MSIPLSDHHPASFRDPSGHIFVEKGVVYRSVNPIFKDAYEQFIQSALYQTLVTEKLLIAHREVPDLKRPDSYKVLQPEYISFISYPYEWSFSQLKDAALTTLRVQLLALEHGFSLKDASAYNIQFHHGKPVLIDTLSFEPYVAGTPWIAYKQFCQHFLAPLALMAHVDLRLGTLSQTHLDGIPLDLAAALLPKKTCFSLGLGTHIHLHARSQRTHANDATSTSKRALPKNSLLGLSHSLESTVRSLRFPKQKTEWGNYYADTNYTAASNAHKVTLVTEWVKKSGAKSVWDTGANDASFSRIASAQGIPTIASDIDPVAVEHAYLQNKQANDANLLPLIIDLTNPSPGIGWRNHERTAFLERGQFDLTLALALIHHLAISNNLPLPLLAAFFAEHTKQLIIEFVPKEDSKTAHLLATREDIFPHYTETGFEAAFGAHFTIQKKVALTESKRSLYLMHRK